MIDSKKTKEEWILKHGNALISLDIDFVRGTFDITPKVDGKFVFLNQKPGGVGQTVAALLIEAFRLGDSIVTAHKAAYGEEIEKQR